MLQFQVMSKFEVEIQNYEGSLNLSGGLSVGFQEKANLYYELNLDDDDNPVRFELSDSVTMELLGVFEVGRKTIALILGEDGNEKRYIVDLHKVGESHVFPTVPPIRFKKVPD